MKKFVPGLLLAVVIVLLVIFVPKLINNDSRIIDNHGLIDEEYENEENDDEERVVENKFEMNSDPENSISGLGGREFIGEGTFLRGMVVDRADYSEDCELALGVTCGEPEYAFKVVDSDLWKTDGEILWISIPKEDREDVKEFVNKDSILKTNYIYEGTTAVYLDKYKLSFELN